MNSMVKKKKKAVVPDTSALSESKPETNGTKRKAEEEVTKSETNGNAESVADKRTKVEHPDA